MREIIPIAEPWITEREKMYVADAITDLSYIERFEDAFAEYVGRSYAISTNSCTSALHLALLALEIGEGDEVIVPDLTWIGSSAAITYVGATPVFCDVDEKTWCIDIEAIKIAITPRTKAIITVDLYGGMPEYNEIIKLAADLGIHIIEDAAEAIGSEYHNHKAGSFGVISCFSFHGSKTLSCGEGGMLVTNKKDINKRVRFLRNHGRIAGSFYNTEVAYKYKLSSVAAGLGLAQLERINELVYGKRAIFYCYKENLCGINDIALNHQPYNVENSYWMSTIMLKHGSDYLKHDLRDKLINYLNERGIETRPTFTPLSLLPAYRKYERRVSNQHLVGINLPSGLMMTEKEIKYVSDNIRSFMNEI